MVNVQFVKKNVQKLKNQSVLLMDKPMKANVKCIKEIVIPTLHGFAKFLMENVNVKEVCTYIHTLCNSNTILLHELMISASLLKSSYFASIFLLLS